MEATRILRDRQKNLERHPTYAPPLVVVAMTASAMPGDREKCLVGVMDDYLAKPVRLEDVRAIVERWGPVAMQAAAAQSKPPANASSGKSRTPEPGQAPVASAAAPVDMSRLLEFTDGTPENLRELVTLYVDQTQEQLNKMLAAIAAGNAAEVRRLAHSCAGASGTCGVGRLTGLLRDLEARAAEQRLENGPELGRQIAEEFGRARDYLRRQLGGAPEVLSRS
jgi:HPt (histidine-containing phosphotransfer) domain-containing protein